MRIGIIGAGNVGLGLTKLLAPRHEIVLSFSRDRPKLEAAAAAIGARAGSVAESASFGEVVVLATPYTANQEASAQAGSPGEGKILWDCTNPLKPDLIGLLVGTTTSGAELTATHAPWARVVKAIPPFAELMQSGSVELGGRKPAVFVCGDDESARETVAGLVRDLGAEPVNAGALALSRYVEPAGMLLVALAYRGGFGGRIGLSLIRG
ncbi:MAG: NAD(P)-binding domain-containing protein [Bryobacteraceae bacterium]|nr:NAD(P)-binding domain-containing protein [Bryobacteraceae bacterium]